MPDINFLAFNTRSFEQFTQALASEVLGRGLMIFGDGPDGGREASHKGELPYPNAVERWRGYTVMQAKFRMRPSADGKDASWLAEQVKAEADKWSELPEVPDYYLLVTNVRLSGVSGKERKGGQQKLDDAFEKHLKPLGVKAMHVWHEAKIATLLDGTPELFRSYRGWLGPRDLIASLFEHYDKDIPKFGQTMLRFIQRELREDRPTRLRQAGHVDDDAIPLDSVFVDLPYQLDQQEQVVAQHHYHQAVTPNGEGRGQILHTLLKAISLKLDPVTIDQTWHARQGPAPIRHLLLGGPGQGKSTITQFLAQVSRARILRQTPSGTLSPDIRQIVEAIEARCVELELPQDGSQRYPLRIDLPTFADELAASGRTGLSILGYVAERIATQADDPRISIEIVRRWLADYPWLLIFDGLDEVPPSANRRDVLAAIAEFWDEAIPLKADVAMIVTTRPQGYNEDLAPDLHVKLEMAKLDAPKALAYAERLSIAKFASSDQRKRVVNRLRQASSHETTALLLVSPLQVAIMLQLVDQRGTAPTDRWSLFHGYLDVVIKREQEKLGEAGRVIREKQRVIEGLLRRAGLLLHVEAESRGGSEAYLTLERLGDMASDLLQEDGFDREAVQQSAAEIVEAAMQRLVFLQQRIEGRVEFEVRSLQEFMAAAELMAGSDDAVRERLGEIAGCTHWQHVFRIAASKAFSMQDAGKYRNDVISTCRAVDANREVTRIIRRGASVALDLVNDGLAHDQPRFRDILCLHAFELIALGPDLVDSRLAQILQRLDLKTTRKMLADYIVSEDTQVRRACWAILFRAMEQDASWIDELVEEWWPTSGDRQLDIPGCGAIPKKDSWAEERLIAILRETHPAELRKALYHGDTAKRRRLASHYCERFPFISSSVFPDRIDEEEVEIFPQSNTSLYFRIVPVSPQKKENIYDPSGALHALARPVREFIENPGTDSLIDFISAMKEDDFMAYFDSVPLPWPLQTVRYLMKSGVSCDDAIGQARQGKFGTADDWLQAEERWREDGVSVEDFQAWADHGVLAHTIANVGAPASKSLLMKHADESHDPLWIRKLVDLALQAKDGPPRLVIRRLLRWAMLWYKVPEGLSAEEFLRLGFAEISDEFAYVDPAPLASLAECDLLDRGLAEELAATGSQDRFSLYSPKTMDPLLLCISLAEAYPDLPGLLTLALAAAGLDGNRIIETARKLRPLLERLERDERKRASNVVLLLAAGLIEVRPAASLLIQETQREAPMLLTLHLCRSELMPTADSETLLTCLAAAGRDRWLGVRDQAIIALRTRCDRETARLSQPECWKLLSLPSSLHNRLRSNLD